MKRLIYILLLVIGWNTLTAQTYQVNNQKIRFMNALGIPAKDTASANWANAADTSIILIRPGDSTLWYRYKGSFRKVGTGGGTAIVDTVNTISSKPWRQKGIDSVSANLIAGLALKLNISDTSLMLSPYYRTALANATIVQRITDSLRALVRIRASGSGGIDVQNSSGTSVANFGSGGSTNISLNGSTNVNARLSVTDSIVGVNQRLSGSLLVSSLGLFNTTNDYNHALQVGGVITAKSTNAVFLDPVSTNVGAFIVSSGNPTSLNIQQSGQPTSIGGSVDIVGTTRSQGALTATAQGNNIVQSVDSAITGTSYTLVLGDAGYFKRVTNSSAVTITIPENSSVAFPVGTYIILQQQGTGQITIAPASSNVSFESPDGALKSRTRYSKLTLLKVNTNRWDIGGDLTN